MIASTTCEAKCFISLKKKDREKVYSFAEN